MGKEYPRDLPATPIAHLRRELQTSAPTSAAQEFDAPFVLLPRRIIDDRKNGSRVRVLAWLITHGARMNNAVMIGQEKLARELHLATSTVQYTLLGLARSRYIEIVVDPVSGHYSYRLASTPEGGE